MAVKTNLPGTIKTIYLEHKSKEHTNKEGKYVSLVFVGKNNTSYVLSVLLDV